MVGMCMSSRIVMGNSFSDHRLHAKVDAQPEEKQQIGLDEDAIQAAIWEFQSEGGLSLGGENSDDGN